MSDLEDITLEEARKNAKEPLKDGTKSDVSKGEYDGKAYVLKEDRISLPFHKLNSNLHHRRLTQPDSESELLKALENTGSVPKLIKAFNDHSFMMEYIEGTPLKQDIENEERIYKVVASLKKIHDAGYYHGDTRTSNIIDDKIIDVQFGGKINSENDVFKDLLIFTYSIGHRSKKGQEFAYNAIGEIYSPETAQKLKDHELTFFEKRLLRKYI